MFSVLAYTAMQSLSPLADCFVDDTLVKITGAIPQAVVLSDN